MNELSIIQKVVSLLHDTPREPGTELPNGACDEDIRRFELSMGMMLPNELVEWLKISNGPCVGPGGLFGVFPAAEYLRIEAVLFTYPEWQEMNWFPIAADGNGNFYVLDGSIEQNGYHPIYFIDHEVDEFTPSYVVASNIWLFIIFLLQSEIDWKMRKIVHWPCDKEYVLSVDPKLKHLNVSVPLPWDKVD